MDSAKQRQRWPERRVPSGEPSLKAGSLAFVTLQLFPQRAPSLTEPSAEAELDPLLPNGRHQAGLVDLPPDKRRGVHIADLAVEHAEEVHHRAEQLLRGAAEACHRSEERRVGQEGRSRW